MSMQNQWHAMRSFTRDPSVTKQRLKPGTVRRITGYARPYRLDLAIFLVAAALDAVVTVLYPVLIGVVIDKGILPKDTTVVLTVAGIVAGLAIFDALLGVVQRYFTSRVGEGLIYDLRTQVFEHVQRQPIAFFTRAQTGSLVSRLNSDVIGAQQALTSTLSSVVSSVLQLVARPRRHVRLLLAGDGRRAGADPDLPVPGPPRRAQAAAADQGIDAARRPDGLDHDGAVQRGRGDAGQAVRAAAPRSSACSPAGQAGSATSAC